MMSPARKDNFTCSCPVCMPVISCLYSLTRTNKTLNRSGKNWLPFTLQMLPGKVSLNTILVVMFLLMPIFREKKKKIPFNPSLLNDFIMNNFSSAFLLQ